MPKSRGAAADDGREGESGPFQREARALGDPTRHAIFRLIEDAGEPVTVIALTERLDLHPSAVRQHLAKLIDAGLVVEVRQPPAGPGRPPGRYRAAPAVLGRWGTESPYERLALLLLEVARSGRSARDVGEEAGRLVARRQAGQLEPLALLEAVATQLGFEPCRQDRGDGVSLVLNRCPYAAAAAADAMVCELHRGLAEGVAGEAGGLAVEHLHRRDPHQGGCRIDLSVTDTKVSTANTEETLSGPLVPADRSGGTHQTRGMPCEQAGFNPPEWSGPSGTTRSSSARRTPGDG
ncbi:MAG TPA: helix-turn-helix domain-containing protein [Acidimicrobiia bacterium]|nr:helix-turn-helix domain-containing protein [Acidimicrobiia bacterium]